MLKKIIPSLLFFLLIISCDSTSQNTTDIPTILEATTTATTDSIINHYKQEIHKYYIDSNTNDNTIELELSGAIEYEDDSILILSFDETLKFGSWHYTNASLCFFKNDTILIPIPTSSDNLELLTDFYKRDLQYPNKINGTLHQIIDLTGDGKPEYIFYATGMIRTNFEENYTIYQLNSINQMLERTNLSISGHGIIASCDTIYGELESFKLIENDTANLTIEIKKVLSTCNDSLGKVEQLNCSYSYYRWQNQENIFKEIPAH